MKGYELSRYLSETVERIGSVQESSLNRNGYIYIGGITADGQEINIMVSALEADNADS